MLTCSVMRVCRLIRILLSGANQVAQSLCHGQVVLVHCSDGWDRTAQLCALAQIMIDPYYRTLQGFADVVEKEWCSFGHKFGQRCGTEPAERADDGNKQRSPVFLQWLDAVWQLMSQYPAAFHFNDRVLRVVAHHAYSDRFGTFMYNCDR